MKIFLSLATLLLLLAQGAFADAYFQPKKEMIETAEVIAIVTIGKVEPSETKGKHWTYHEAAPVKTEAVLKGELPGEFTLNGEESFRCARCALASGRFLVFLRKDGPLWAGSNWQLSLRPISGDSVDWYFGDDNHYEMKPQPLKEVRVEIESVLAGAKP